MVAYLRLMRPANIITAWADILLGVGLAASVQGVGIELSSAIWLLLSTTGLYGGGVVFNDVFDYELDCVERPERPLPSGAATRGGAIALGLGLLLLGVWSAAQVHPISAAIAIITALLALIYDAWAKHDAILGPITMGSCRAFNLLLGVSSIPIVLGSYWPIGLVHLLYIGGITLISRGEVHGGDRRSIRAAIVLFVFLCGIILLLSIGPHYRWETALPILLGFVGMVFPPLFRAHRDPSAKTVRLAVRSGVLALILLDATLAAGFQDTLYGLGMLALLPLSLALAKIFAVT